MDEYFNAWHPSVALVVLVNTLLLVALGALIVYLLRRRKG